VFWTFLEFYGISSRVDGDLFDSVCELCLPAHTLYGRVSELSHIDFYGRAEVSWVLDDVLVLRIFTHLEDKLPHVIFE
jgi:hypothetical protein